MKIRTLGFIALLVSSPSVLANSLDSEARAINVFNLTAADIRIWVSGVESVVSPVSGYQVPCLPGEVLEVQYGETLTNVDCGDTMEISYE